MKFEHTEVYGFEGALRGMRNPLESWDKGDSRGERSYPSLMGGVMWVDKFVIGENDLKLARKLIMAGSDHSKFMRQIIVSVDITAPLYWWKEFDCYRVGVVANSTSTMHKLSSTPITDQCFEMADFENVKVFDDNVHPLENSLGYYLESHIQFLEKLRTLYLETNDKQYWKELIRWLPCGWLQTRTVTMSYQNIRAMYFARNSHKLTEWSEGFVDWVMGLPYAEELIMLNQNGGLDG